MCERATYSHLVPLSRLVPLYGPAMCKSCCAPSVSVAFTSTRAYRRMLKVPRIIGGASDKLRKEPD